MKRTLRVLRDAEAELQSAAIWYEEKRRGLGIEFVLKRFPYVVFFRIGSSTVEIVAVAHAKRRPGYWLDRRR